jgi:hypothetical protein
MVYIYIQRHLSLYITNGGLFMLTKKKKEYFTVRDQDGKVVGKREVTSKVDAHNVAGYIINGTLVYSYWDYVKMQEEATLVQEIPVSMLIKIKLIIRTLKSLYNKLKGAI